MGLNSRTTSSQKEDIKDLLRMQIVEKPVKKSDVRGWNFSGVTGPSLRV